MLGMVNFEPVNSYLAAWGQFSRTVRYEGQDIPCSLTIIGSLATGLEIKPLSHQMGLVSSIVCQAVSLVVSLDKVGKNGARLPKDKVYIRVFDDCLDVSLLGAANIGI